MVEHLQLGSSGKPLSPLCMPQGARVLIPPGASDDVVKKALTSVLASRIEQVEKASHPDTLKYAESLALHLMRYMRQCGEVNRTSEIPRLLINPPNKAECDALEACLKNMIRFGDPKSKTVYDLVKPKIGRLWSLIKGDKWVEPKTPGATGPRG